MGNLIWHEYSRLVSISASVYGTWAGFFGLFYRKYFWDFVGGTMRDPGGLQAPPSAAPMIAIIIKVPIVPIFAMLVGIILILLETPLPMLRSTSLHRSFHLRVVLLLVQFVLNILYYQGTNAAIWSLIAAGGYLRATMRGEVMKEAKENRGKAGAA